MATVEEVSSRVAFVRSQLEKCLQRCQNAPYSSFERTRRIQELQDEANSIAARIANEVRLIEGPARESLESIGRQLGETQLALADFQRQQRDLQRVLQAAQQEYTAKVQAALTKGLSPESITKEWQTEQAEFQRQQAELGRKIATIQGELGDGELPPIQWTG